MTIPERYPDPLVWEVAEHHIPVLLEWLNGNRPEWGWAITLPVMRAGHATQLVIIHARRWWAPAPWTGTPYVYVWPVAVLDGCPIVNGEPYRQPIGQ